MNKKTTLSYAGAGVDIDRGAQMVDRITGLCKDTDRPGVMGSLGGFGALFDLGALSYQDPILVATTDGVGTKVKLAAQAGEHMAVGIDLVAMCVNDLLVQGAQPLFFLDYFATSTLQLPQAEELLRGITFGCQQAGCALIGGETAEMPGIYQAGEYDLAGFCVGAVERTALIDGSHVQAGDCLLGIASSGLHANGFSLVRAVLEQTGAVLSDPWQDSTLQQALLAPTRIYVESILSLLQACPVTALAHITGGGLLENIPRSLPTTLGARIAINSWIRPPIFNWLQTCGDIAAEEMWRVFNCGVGIVVCVPATEKQRAIDHLHDAGEVAWLLGEIVPHISGQDRIILCK